MASDENRLRVLEARLQLLEDDKAIREVLARYGYNADQGRDNAYVNLFTEDGVLDLSTGPGRPGGNSPENAGKPSPDEEVVVRYDGHDAIRGFITNPKGHKAIEGQCLHVMGNNLTT